MTLNVVATIYFALHLSLALFMFTAFCAYVKSPKPFDCLAASMSLLVGLMEVLAANRVLERFSP